MSGMIQDDFVTEISKQIATINTKIDHLTSLLDAMYVKITKNDEVLKAIQINLSRHSERLQQGAKSFDDLRQAVNRLQNENVSKIDCYNRHTIWRDWMKIILGAMLGASLPVLFQVLKGG